MFVWNLPCEVKGVCSFPQLVFLIRYRVMILLPFLLPPTLGGVGGERGGKKSSVLLVKIFSINFSCQLFFSLIAQVPTRWNWLIILWERVEVYIYEYQTTHRSILSPLAEAELSHMSNFLVNSLQYCTAFCAGLGWWCSQRDKWIVFCSL